MRYTQTQWDREIGWGEVPEEYKYKTKLEREHLDKVSQLGCICCGAIAEIHHIRDKVGMGRRSSHFETLPLCPIHHRLGKDSIHLGKKNFIKGSTFTSISKLTTKKARQNELIELIGGGFTEANNYASTLIDRAAA